MIVLAHNVTITIPPQAAFWTALLTVAWVIYNSRKKPL